MRGPVRVFLHRKARSDLEENSGAAAVQLSPDDLRNIDAAVDKLPVHGARYPPQLQALVGR